MNPSSFSTVCLLSLFLLLQRTLVVSFQSAQAPLCPGRMYLLLSLKEDRPELGDWAEGGQVRLMGGCRSPDDWNSKEFGHLIDPFKKKKILTAPVPKQEILILN